MKEWKLLALALVGYLCVSLANAVDGPMCYSCERVSHLQDCSNLQQCGPHQECFVQRLLASNLAEYFKLGCIDRDICQTQFSFYGFSPVGKRSVAATKPPPPEIRKRISDTDMLMCLQCCNGSYCNYRDGLCGAPPSQYRRCFNCPNVDKPHECDAITECGSSEECFVHKYRSSADHELRFELTCKPTLVCDALIANAAQVNIGCVKCCNHSDYCNFNACDHWHDPYSSPTTASTTPFVIPTKPPTTTRRPVPTRPLTTAVPTTPRPAPVPTIRGTATANYGEMVNLNCDVTEDVNAIRWNFNSSTALPRGAFSGTNGHLIVSPLQAANVGTYTCVVIAKNGQISMKSITVGIAQSPAHVVSVTRDPARLMSPGEKFRIICTVTGYPLPIDITWTFTDTVGVSIIPSNVDYTQNRRVLTIASYAGTFHDGRWTCNANNTLGGDSGHIDIPW